MNRFLRKSFQQSAPALRRNFAGHGEKAAHSNGIGGEPALFHAERNQGWEWITLVTYGASFLIVFAGLQMKELDSYKVSTVKHGLIDR
jgi:hypothetical protein